METADRGGRTSKHKSCAPYPKQLYLKVFDRGRRTYMKIDYRCSARLVASGR